MNHGESRNKWNVGTREWLAWHNMIQRCENPRHYNYPLYGGRGVIVCKRWRKSYPAFLKDMGRRPTSAHSLDRVDNDGDYTPKNCRWATAAEQSGNRRSSRVIRFRGVTMCLSAWARKVGIRKDTLRVRLVKCRWSVARALTTPVRCHA